MIESCVIIGSGNLAYHISKAFQTTDINILQLFGRNEEKTKSIAQKFNIPYCIDELDLILDADIYIICVSDSAIDQVAAIDQLKNKFLVHVAGSINISVLAKYTQTYGVMYPLQTFSSFRDLSYSEIPFFIEGSSTQEEDELTEFVKNISEKICIMNSRDRLYLHLSAVIANNFSNHMFAIADQLLKKHKLSFDYLRPLILETAQKAMISTPLDAQTGPAVRNNPDVMAKHIELLNEHDDWQKIYTFVSNSIYNLSQNKQ